MCETNNPCTTDSCNSVTGCQHTYSTPQQVGDNPCVMRVCEPRTGNWVTVPTGVCPPCFPEGAPCESDEWCCPGHVCGPYEFDGFEYTACIPPCGVAGGCRTGCGSYILARPFGIAGSIYVDDDLRVSVNGATVFDSATGSPAFYVGPVGPFSASAGNTLTVEATNTFGGRQALDRVSLFCADGSAAQLVTEGFSTTTASTISQPPPRS